MKVNLAGDKQVTVRMSQSNVIVGDEKVEPIVPLGALIADRGCAMQWSGDHLIIHHRVRGVISTFIHGGCPMVSREESHCGDGGHAGGQVDGH